MQIPLGYWARLFERLRMSNSRRSASTEIPRGIQEQESEIESMFRNLIRHGDGSCLNQMQHLPNPTPAQAALHWLLIAMLGLASVIAFVILWLKV